MFSHLQFIYSRFCRASWYGSFGRASFRNCVVRNVSGSSPGLYPILFISVVNILLYYIALLVSLSIVRTSHLPMETRRISEHSRAFYKSTIKEPTKYDPNKLILTILIDGYFVPAILIYYDEIYSLSAM